MPYITQQAKGLVLLRLHVQPKAATNRVTGLYGDCLKIAVAAPPVDGRANEHVVQYLADLLGLLPRDVLVKSGFQSRRKTLVISGLSSEEIRERLLKCLETNKGNKAKGGSCVGT